MHEMKETHLANDGLAQDKTFEVGSKLIRTRICKSPKPLLDAQAAQHNVAYLIRAWLVCPQGKDIIESDCKCGFTERVDTVHQSQVTQGILTLMSSNPGMTENEARIQWWASRQDTQRQLAAEECYAKTALMMDGILELEVDPDEAHPRLNDVANLEAL